MDVEEVRIKNIKELEFSALTILHEFHNWFINDWIVDKLVVSGTLQVDLNFYKKFENQRIKLNEAVDLCNKIYLNGEVIYKELKFINNFFDDTPFEVKKENEEIVNVLILEDNFIDLHESIRKGINHLTNKRNIESEKEDEEEIIND